MLTLLTISVLLTVLYTGAVIWKRRSLPESISAMVFELPKCWQILWSVWLALVALFTFIPVIEILDEKYDLGAIGFVAMMLLIFVAAWPLYDKEHKAWHYAFGIAAGVISQICVFLIDYSWLFLWLIFFVMAIAMLIYPDKTRWLDRKGVFVAEKICYLTLIGTIITYHLTNYAIWKG